jgi:hypothetical protein
MSKTSNDRWRLQNKLIALYHYSKGTLTCGVCGTGEINELTVDHIDGGGNEHRKLVIGRLSGSSGTEFYTWLIKNNLPEGLQTLCFGCNCAKNCHIITRETALSMIKDRLKLEELPIDLSGLVKIQTNTKIAASVKAYFDNNK